MSAPSELVRPLFSADVAVVEGDPRRSWSTGALYPEEEAVVARAVEKRQREFTAGRVFARRAMDQLGVPTGPILADDRRAPVWPAGVVGTISHTRRWCVAAVARDSELVSIAADVEEVGHLDDGVRRMVCSADELAAIGRLGASTDWAKLVFCAKECAYKAQYPLSRTFLGFEAMTVDLHPDSAAAGAEVASGRFVACFRLDALPFHVGDCLEGRFLRRDGLWATAMELPRTDPPL